MRSLTESSYRRTKVYNLQIVDIGAIKKIEPGVTAWAAEAASQPLVRARLPHGVPKHWLIDISGSSVPLRVQAEQFKTFMDQIGYPFNDHTNVL